MQTRSHPPSQGPLAGPALIDDDGGNIDPAILHLPATARPPPPRANLPPLAPGIDPPNLHLVANARIMGAILPDDPVPAEAAAALNMILAVHRQDQRADAEALARERAVARAQRRSAMMAAKLKNVEQVRPPSAGPSRPPGQPAPPQSLSSDSGGGSKMEYREKSLETEETEEEDEDEDEDEEQLAQNFGIAKNAKKGKGKEKAKGKGKRGVPGVGRVEKRVKKRVLKVLDVEKPAILQGGNQVIDKASHDAYWTVDKISAMLAWNGDRGGDHAEHAYAIWADPRSRIMTERFRCEACVKAATSIGEEKFKKGFHQLPGWVGPCMMATPYGRCLECVRNARVCSWYNARKARRTVTIPYDRLLEDTSTALELVEGHVPYMAGLQGSERLDRVKADFVRVHNLLQGCKQKLKEYPSNSFEHGPLDEAQAAPRIATLPRPPYLHGQRPRAGKQGNPSQQKDRSQKSKSAADVPSVPRPKPKPRAARKREYQATIDSDVQVLGDEYDELESEEGVAPARVLRAKNAQAGPSKARKIAKK